MGRELDWFSSYLTNREQFVAVAGGRSASRRIRLGVPQGSILGPILFLIYINDLPGCSGLISKLFADDTTLLANDSDPVALEEKMNLEFQKVCNYFRLNKLSLTPKKPNS